VFVQCHDQWTSTTIGQDWPKVNAEAPRRRSLLATGLARGAAASCVFKAEFPKLDVVQGYEKYLYTRAQKTASTCWCKEKSSTVSVDFGAGGGSRTHTALAANGL